jgi:hypothetical protein
MMGAIYRPKSPTITRAPRICFRVRWRGDMIFQTFARYESECTHSLGQPEMMLCARQSPIRSALGSRHRFNLNYDLIHIE